MVRVYVTAPRESAAQVRNVHVEIERIGCKPTSIWADLSTDTIDLDDERGRVHRVLHELSAKALDEAHVVLVVSDGQRDTSEMCFEVGRAMSLNKPILWLGPRRVLACYSPDIKLVTGLEDAIERIRAAAKQPLQVFKDVLMCGLDAPPCPRCGNLAPIPNPLPNTSKSWFCKTCQAAFDRVELTPRAS